MVSAVWRYKKNDAVVYDSNNGIPYRLHRKLFFGDIIILVSLHIHYSFLLYGLKFLRIPLHFHYICRKLHTIPKCLTLYFWFWSPLKFSWRVSLTSPLAFVENVNRIIEEDIQFIWWQHEIGDSTYQRRPRSQSAYYVKKTG